VVFIFLIISIILLWSGGFSLIHQMSLDYFWVLIFNSIQNQYKQLDYLEYPGLKYTCNTVVTS